MSEEQITTRTYPSNITRSFRGDGVTELYQRSVGA